MFIGLDLGTSGVRAVLVRPDGSVLDSTESGLRARHPALGWSEQDPADWVSAARTAMPSMAEAR